MLLGCSMSKRLIFYLKKVFGFEEKEYICVRLKKTIYLVVSTLAASISPESKLLEKWEVTF